MSEEVPFNKPSRGLKLDSIETGREMALRALGCIVVEDAVMTTSVQ